MKTLINHLLKTNLEEIINKSKKHCHIKNLHSIMLLECPSKTIRLFVAVPGNELYKNNPYNNETQSVAYHGHHCQLTLSSVFGQFQNIIIKESASSQSKEIAKYLYKSKLLNNKGGFEFISKTFFDIISSEIYDPNVNKSCFMEASEIHTVVTPKNEYSAWLVFEGKEDKNYKPYCYSNADLSLNKLDGLYQPMSKEDIFNLLLKINLV